MVELGPVLDLLLAIREILGPTPALDSFLCEHGRRAS
jgi:hypothetical protein